MKTRAQIDEAIQAMMFEAQCHRAFAAQLERTADEREDCEAEAEMLESFAGVLIWVADEGNQAAKTFGAFLARLIAKKDQIVEAYCEAHAIKREEPGP